MDVERGEVESSIVFSPLPVMTRTTSSRPETPSGDEPENGGETVARRGIAENAFVLGQETLGPDDFIVADALHHP